MKDDLVVRRTILFDRQVAGNIVNFAMLGKREVGYWIGKEFWGRDIASEALKQLLSEVKTRARFMLMSQNKMSHPNGFCRNADSKP